MEQSTAFFACFGAGILWFLVKRKKFLTKKGQNKAVSSQKNRTKDGKHKIAAGGCGYGADKGRERAEERGFAVQL